MTCGKIFLWAATVLLLWTCSASGGGPRDSVELIFLDVGQGDAVVIRAPEGKVALVDAGPDADIVALLQQHGIDTIDLAVSSHPHTDHIGGMAAVLASMPVRYYMDNGVPHTTATYLGLIRTLRDSDVIYLEATQRTIELGSVKLKVLPPPSEPTDNLNNQSVGLVVEFGEFRALLTGDSEVAELNHFLALGVPNVTVLKAAHHGSRNGVTPAWLSATKPVVVVISCGAGNQYGHPHPWALRYYQAVAKEIYRTDLDGEVTIGGFGDGRYVVATARHRTVEEHVREQPPTADEPPEIEAGITLWVFADAPGNDHYNLNGEYAVIANDGEREVKIGGWTLCDAARHCFRFPDEARIRPGAQAVIYTGAGVIDGTHFYMNSSRAVWNNDGDVATLRDGSGQVVATYAY